MFFRNFPDISPDELIEVGFDLDDYLPEGLVVESVTFSAVVADESEVSDGSVGSRFVGSPSIAISGRRVAQQFDNGVNGVSYMIHALCTCSDDQVYQASGLMRCRKPA